MRRRHFLKALSSVAGLTAMQFPEDTLGAESGSHEFASHKIEKVEFLTVKYRWPRPVGKNARIGVHGQHKKAPIVKVTTDQGAMGWGLGRRNREAAEAIQGKPVSELCSQNAGLLPGVPRTFDFALHDLMGVILDKPVYKLLGGKGPRENPIYSGMIYFDELEPPENPSGFDKVIANCQWDIEYGYRQLKVKIGRSGRWYPHDKGLRADVDIVNLIDKTFADQGVQILVDANDMYSLGDTKKFLQGIKEVPLYWLEEPFAEDSQQTSQLSTWMHANGFEKTYLADGEFQPDLALCMELYKAGALDVCLHDVAGYGFTRWRQLMPQLEKIETLASPHAWGSRLKTHYCTHLAAGLGNCCTIEGVTCESDDVDFGDYPIRNGKIRVSDAPGFGMKLLV